MAQGRRYRLGWTDTHAGIWRRRPWAWTTVARYPLGDEGLQAAQQHFARLEPDAVYVNLTSGTPMPGTGRSLLGLVGVGVAVLAAVAALVLVALRPSPGGARVGATPTTSTTVLAQAPPGGGWLSSSTSEVDYLSWSGAAAGSFTGSLTRVRVAGQAPNLTSSSTEQAVTGSLAGRQVALSVAGSPVVYGTLSGRGLAVEWPQSDGSFVQQAFVPVTGSGKDQAVRGLALQAIDANAASAPPSCASGVCLPVPPAPVGYVEVGRIGSPTGQARAGVQFAGRPLELCFAAATTAVQRLTFEIGSSLFGGPTKMFDSSGGNLVTNGCARDPGNDSDREQVTIRSGGPGAYVVVVYQSAR